MERESKRVPMVWRAVPLKRKMYERNVLDPNKTYCPLDTAEREGVLNALASDV